MQVARNGNFSTKKGFFQLNIQDMQDRGVKTSPKDKLTLFKKSFSGQKTAPLQTPTKSQCTDATLLQLKSAATTLGPPKEEKKSIGGTKGKFLKEKLDFFYKTFFLE